MRQCDRVVSGNPGLRESPQAVDKTVVLAHPAAPSKSARPLRQLRGRRRGRGRRVRNRGRSSEPRRQRIPPQLNCAIICGYSEKRCECRHQRGALTYNFCVVNRYIFPKSFVAAGYVQASHFCRVIPAACYCFGVTQNLLPEPAADMVRLTLPQACATVHSHSRTPGCRDTPPSRSIPYPEPPAFHPLSSGSTGHGPLHRSCGF